MRSLLRPASLWWPVGLSAALVLILPSQRALAQSSLGAPLNNATAQSILDAVRQNERELIDREVLGGSPGGQGTGSSAGGGSVGLNTFSTGRLRSSDHDALSVPPGGDSSGGSGPFPYRTSEVSAFSNIVVAMPGTVLGGQLKLSGFVGSNTVYLQLKSDSLNILDPDQDGRARNESLIFGGTALWSKQNTYALATIVGTVGQSTLKDSVDDCYAAPPYPANFCHHNRYSFNTAGLISTLTAGQVFDLSGKSGPKLDVRGSIGYTHNAGDTFTNVFTDTQRYTLSTFTGTGGVTLFTNMVLQDKSLLRPYIQAYVRQEWGYDNKLNFNIAGTGPGSGPGTVQYDQAHLYGGLDGGVAYVQGNTTFGASIYYEGSGSERTLGGRLGLSQKLDDINFKSKTPNWSGFYVGVNAGGAWGQSQIGSSVACIDNDDNNAFGCLFLTPPEGPGTGPAVSAAGTGTLSDRAFTAGVQGGFNLQTKGLVFGLEADTQSFRLSSSQSVTVPGATVVTSFDTDWLFTVRSRVGLPIAPSLLVYATTGFALTDLSVSNSVTTIGAASQRGLVMGKVFGAGAEWALTRNWTLRGEYLYLDFGNVTVNAPTVQPPSDYNTARTTADLTAQVVRMGLNYKF